MPDKRKSYLPQLRDQIANTFDLEELRTITFDLQLDWDELSGARKTNRIQDLITQLAQNGRLGELVELLKHYRPRINWPQIPAAEQQKQDIRIAFPQKPFYQQPLIWAGAIALLAVIGISLTTWFGGQTTDRINQLPGEIAAAIPTNTPIPTPTNTPTPSLTPLPFQPARDNETLIVIATFYRAEGLLQNAEVHNEIRRAIQANIDELNLGNEVQVKVEPTILRTENRDEAEALGNNYNATLIIWGEETSARIEVSFLNLKEPDFDAAEATISETETTQITSVANPEAYIAFVLEDLPGQLSFLSFFALGQTAYSQENYEEAIELIETAVGSLTNLSESTSLELDAAYFRLGWLYRDTQRFLQAIDAFNQTINLNPYMITAYVNRGASYSNLEVFEKAIEDYSQALSLNSEYIAAYNNRGIAYANIGEYELALSDYEKAISISPDFAEVYTNRGSLLDTLGDYELAIADYTKSLTLDPELYMAFFNRGIAYNKLGEYQLSILDYDKAIELNPTADAYSGRGNSYQGLGNYDQAISDYNEAIIRNPTYAEAFNNRGTVYREQGDYTNALNDFNQAITLNPAFAEVYVNRGITYADLMEYEQAISDYDQAILINPEFAHAYFGRGSTYRTVGEFEKAIADYNISISLRPEFADAYISRGIAYADLQNYDQAIIDYEQAIILNPDEPKAFNSLGNAYLALRNYAEAISAYNQAVTINPNFVEVYNNRGIAHLRLQEFELAIADFDQVIATNPEIAAAYYNRGLSYKNIQEYDLAFADFQQYIFLEPQTTLESAWNNVCWFGSLLGHAEEVVSACDKALALARDEQTKASYADSRGLNKALQGDYEGAISDFQTFVDFFDSVSGYENYVAKRISWINSLNSNENPFDAETIEELLNE